jgi:hypothetical protein
VQHVLVAGNPPLNSVGEWRKLACLDKAEELLAGDIGAGRIRHHGSEVLGRLEAQAATLLRIRKISEHRG